MRLTMLAGAFALLCTAAEAGAPLEAYGELPDVRAMDMSPSGKRFAYLSHQNGGDYFVVADRQKGMIGGARTGDVKARSVLFASEDHALLIVSQTESAWSSSKWENSAAFSYDIATGKLTQLLRSYKELYPAQSGLGRVVGRLEGTNDVFMPAFVGSAGNPELSLLKVDLGSTGASIAARGNANTADWIVDRKGVILAREDYEQKTKTHRVFTKRSGDWEKIHETKGVEVKFNLVGSLPGGSALVVVRSSALSDHSSLATLGFDGKLSPPIFQRRDASIESVLIDANREVIGVQFSGLFPTYEFFDAQLGRDMADLASLYQHDAVRLAGWTGDFRKLLITIEGGGTAPAYFEFDRGAKTIARLAKLYSEIDSAEVSQIATIEYRARDNRVIPSILTLPNSADLGDTLPLIVMPHGGPQAYDSVGFDWMAQYFASRGYMVFQPNFRGSDGFGSEHVEAGYGEWGGKMQDDLTDGVNLLVRKGWADPNRICIVGGSYGGYAALAGGAFTPDLYKCVAAIAPVSDLNYMLTAERRESGADSAVVAYWQKLIGDQKRDQAKIAAISPVNAASSFKAPVLLLHGTDDSVVPFAHSARMEAALKKAGKPVSLVKLKGEDHWLSKSETRLQTLRELDSFVARTIGSKN